MDQALAPAGLEEGGEVACLRDRRDAPALWADDAGQQRAGVVAVAGGDEPVDRRKNRAWSAAVMRASNSAPTGRKWRIRRRMGDGAQPEVADSSVDLAPGVLSDSVIIGPSQPLLAGW